MIFKPHSWVEIDRGALEQNLSHLKKITGSGTVAPVIKGNGYGHGLLEMGRVCQESPHVGCVCVASLSEALTLRQKNFTKPILVLVFLDEDATLAIEHDIDVMVYNEETARYLHECAQKKNKICNIHLKIDTGLSRLGIAPEAVENFINKIKQLVGLRLRAVATHFAESQSQDTSFSLEQIKTFNDVIQTIENTGTKIEWKHASNSAGLFQFGAQSGNFFRPGLGTYGYWSSDHTKKIAQENHPYFTLQPALTWKTKIFDIKKVPAGKDVGYSRTFRTSRETVLACLPVGYQDGYNRKLSNKAPVLIENKHAPVVGAVGMNITTIDVTDIPHSKIGTEVILLGSNQKVRADTLSAISETNTREIMTRISPELVRTFV